MAHTVGLFCGPEPAYWDKVGVLSKWALLVMFLGEEVRRSLS